MKNPILKQIPWLIAVGVAAVACLPAYAQGPVTLSPTSTSPPPLGSSDYFAWGDFYWTLPEGSPLEGQIIVPVDQNGNPIPANHFGPTLMYDLSISGAPLSDVFGTILVNDRSVFAFWSENDANPLSSPPSDFLVYGTPIAVEVEGVPVDAGTYVPGATFFSDADVPDGAMTSLLLGIGCMALAALRRKLA